MNFMYLMLMVVAALFIFTVMMYIQKKEEEKAKKEFERKMELIDLKYRNTDVQGKTN